MRKKGVKMTNLEWLEKIKKGDEHYINLDKVNNYIYRQAKALEIIAEELIKLNESLKYGMVEYKVEE